MKTYSDLVALGIPVEVLQALTPQQIAELRAAVSR